MKRTLVMLGLSVVLVGCGGSDTDTPEAAACETVPADLLGKIAAGAEKDVGDLSLSNGRAYRSPDFEQVYFVAADITAPNVDEQTGVWATNNLGDGGVFMAVDGMAKEFTTWPDADSTDANISGADPGIKRAKDC